MLCANSSMRGGGGGGGGRRRRRGGAGQHLEWWLKGRTCWFKFNCQTTIIEFGSHTTSTTTKNYLLEILLLGYKTNDLTSLTVTT